MGSDYGQWGSMDTGWGSSDDKDGSSPLKCWRFRELILILELKVAEFKFGRGLHMGIGGQQILSGKCHHSNPFECKCCGKHFELDEGQANQNIKTTRTIFGGDGSESPAKEEKDCLDCPGEGNDQDNMGPDPLEEIFGDDLVLSELGGFMDAACAMPDRFGHFLRVEKERLCHVKPKWKSKGCNPNLCKKPLIIEIFNHQTKDLPHTDPGNKTHHSLAGMLVKGGLPLDEVCDAWKAAKPCLFDGDGNPQPGAGDRLKKCLDDEGPGVGEVTTLNFYILTKQWDNYKALIAKILKRITDCLCKVGK